jgi:two-component system KDP operon response regulator KdpE
VDQVSAQRTILVVEDDPTMLEILRIFLEDSGCRVLAANTGRSAIDTVRAENPDVMTLDLGLPDMDGREVLRELQSARGGAGPRVIIVTAQRFVAQPGDRVTAVLMKPFDAAELEQVVRAALAAAAATGPARLP